MSIDAYSLCPGGTGKKIKFCCGDFLPELQKVVRMIEGEQYAACVRLVDQLLAREPGRDRECLWSAKCLALRITGQKAAAKAAAELFVAKHPENQNALGEAAICEAEHDAYAALDLQQRAVRAANGRLGDRAYLALGAVADAFLREGRPLAARGLLQLQAQLSKHDDLPRRLLSRLAKATGLSLLLREDMPFDRCPTGVAWEDRFDEAARAIGMGDWQMAAAKFTALTTDVPDCTALWRNLAILRGWLADNSGCIEALRRYSELRAREEGGLEDAVEAEATAMFLSDDPLGDQVELYSLNWTVKDADRAFEALSSSPRWYSIPFDREAFTDGETPPPKAAYAVLNRPMPSSDEGLSEETISSIVGHAFLFGRQTDREARLEVINASANELPAIEQMVREIVGGHIEPEAERKVMGHVSATRTLLAPAWLPPRGAAIDRLDAMADRNLREAVFDRWPDAKLGIFDNRSPREVAGDVALRVRLLAAIYVVEFWTEQIAGEIDFNELRSRLGLPTLGPIEPGDRPIATPLMRLARLEVERLSDDDLIYVYHRASVYAIRSAERKFAQAIIDRPSLAESDERFSTYATLAGTEGDMSRAIEHIAQGRMAAEKAGQPGGRWDLMELSLRLGNRDAQGALRLVEHIEKHHLEETGIAQALTQMLIDVGALNPDGTPATIRGDRDEAMAGEPAMAAAATEPGGLWTPDSGQSGGGGKLWTPE